MKLASVAYFASKHPLDAFCHFDLIATQHPSTFYPNDTFILITLALHFHVPLCLSLSVL